MISKELLSEVLGEIVLDCFITYPASELKVFVVDEDGHDGKRLEYINIHELAHKCKEWSIQQGYHIYSSKGTKTTNAESYILRIWDLERLKTFWEESEPEAIFKACEWIQSIK
jgi:hypothetical protein